MNLRTFIDHAKERIAAFQETDSMDALAAMQTDLDTALLRAKDKFGANHVETAELEKLSNDLLAYRCLEMEPEATALREARIAVRVLRKATSDFIGTVKTEWEAGRINTIPMITETRDQTAEVQRQRKACMVHVLDEEIDLQLGKLLDGIIELCERALEDIRNSPQP